MSKVRDNSMDMVDDEFTCISDEDKERLESQWERIGISNDFVFCKVMQDEDLLRESLARILPQLSISSVEILSQKVVEVGSDIHGVRFDIFATLADGTTVDIEMQMLNKGNLRKRMRYYGSIADIQMLDRGILYNSLNDSYIIMICLFDLFEKGRHIYTFRNRCIEELDLELGDGTTKIVLNAKGTAEDISCQLRAFLDYVANGTTADEYTERLDAAVNNAKMNKKWRREYMIANMRDLENQEEGVQKEQKRRISYMLEQGKTPQAIADFCGYPLKLVEEIQNSMLAIR